MSTKMLCHLKAVGAVILRHAATIVLIFGVMWTVGAPAAEKYIRSQVDAVVEQRITALETAVNDIRTSQNQQSVNIGVAANKLDNVREQQRLIQTDIREILRNLRSSN